MVLQATKGFKEVAAKIRAGEVDVGLAELGSIRAPEPFKAMVRGEVAAFQHDWETCLVESRRVVEAALGPDSPWYSGNPDAEHLRLNTFAALRAGQEGQAITWLDKLGGPTGAPVDGDPRGHGTGGALGSHSARRPRPRRAPSRDQ